MSLHKIIEAKPGQQAGITQRISDLERTPTGRKDGDGAISNLVLRAAKNAEAFLNRVKGKGK